LTTPNDLFVRSIMLYGREGFERLQNSFVAVAGLGGVGSYAAEALARAGTGRLRLIDCEVIKPSNVNRQLLALSTNIGTPKVDVARDRLLSINPALKVDARYAFFHADTADELITSDLDFVVDAIDGLNPKCELIRHCAAKNIPVISALGAAGRTDPSRVTLARLDETSVCPLARDLRRYLRRRGASTDVPVVYSTEPPIKGRKDVPLPDAEQSGAFVRGRPRQPLPTLSTIPAIFGLVAANYVIIQLLQAKFEAGNQ
jgi:tRNA A37 threonylcarbamoyladenosine dehydratase